MTLSKWTVWVAGGIAALGAAAPAAAQGGARTASASVPGWIGFFARVDEASPGPLPSIVVLAVADGSPAARAGLGEGDTLVAVDGVPLTVDGFKSLQSGLHAGDRIDLTV